MAKANKENLELQQQNHRLRIKTATSKIRSSFRSRREEEPTREIKVERHSELPQKR